MLKEAIATGTTVEEAKENAFKKLGTESENVDFEILELPEKKIFGLFGGKLAKVRVYVGNDSSCKDSAPEKVVPKNTDYKSKKGANLKSETVKTDDKPVLISENNIDVVCKNNAADLTEAESLEIENKAIEYIKLIVQHLVEDIDSVKFSTQKTNSGITIKIESEDAKNLIGFRGETLVSMQTLVNLSVRNSIPEDKYFRICLDVCDYRKKHEKALISLAKSKAAYARKTHRKISLKPMSAFDRKIVHSALQKEKGVVSWSEGSGNRRHIIIAVESSTNASNKASYSQKTKSTKTENFSSNKQTDNLNLDNCIEIKGEVDSSPLYGKISR